VLLRSCSWKEAGELFLCYFDLCQGSPLIVVLLPVGSGVPIASDRGSYKYATGFCVCKALPATKWRAGNICHQKGVPS
jgi:hypothetical protein